MPYFPFCAVQAAEFVKASIALAFTITTMPRKQLIPPTEQQKIVGHRLRVLRCAIPMVRNGMLRSTTVSSIPGFYHSEVRRVEQGRGTLTFMSRYARTLLELARESPYNISDFTPTDQILSEIEDAFTVTPNKDSNG